MIIIWVLLYLGNKKNNNNKLKKPILYNVKYKYKYLIISNVKYIHATQIPNYLELWPPKCTNSFWTGKSFFLYIPNYLGCPNQFGMYKLDWSAIINLYMSNEGLLGKFHIPDSPIVYYWFWPEWNLIGLPDLWLVLGAYQFSIMWLPG